MQLRSHLHRNALPRQRQIIPIELLEPPDIPHPVKIIHLTKAPQEEPLASTPVP